VRRFAVSQSAKYVLQTTRLRRDCSQYLKVRRLCHQRSDCSETLRRFQSLAVTHRLQSVSPSTRLWRDSSQFRNVRRPIYLRRDICQTRRMPLKYHFSLPYQNRLGYSNIQFYSLKAYMIDYGGNFFIAYTVMYLFYFGPKHASPYVI
jgi:hypothetical protein